MGKTVLLTLGRLPKALDVARALSKAGCRVLVAEPFAWHLARTSRFVDKCFQTPAPAQDQDGYVAALLNIIERESVDIVVPISEEVLHASLIVDRLPARVSFFSVGHDRLRSLHDKYRFNRIASEAGLTVPETHLLGSGDARLFAARSDYILKPSNTCSGKGFSAHTRGTRLPSAEPLPATLVQEQMKGALKSTLSICHDGKVLGTVVYRAAILSDSVAVAFERLDGEDQIEAWISRFAKATDHSGFIAFDMMEDEDGIPHAIECNPRTTSGIHFVEEKSLAQAILEPENVSSLRLSEHRLQYQFWSSLTEMQSAAFGKDSALEKLAIMWRAKEVNFRFSDPLPVWLMPFSSWEIMKRAFLNGQTFGEASTFDLEWTDADEVAPGQMEISSSEPQGAAAVS